MMKLVVLSCLLAAASAGVLAPIVPYGAISPYAAISPFAGISPYTAFSPLPWGDNNYRGPLSLAPGEPADILGADGRPLDTLEVNQDRAAHLTAKALGTHLLKKRSAAVIAPIATPLTTPLATPLVAHSSLIAPASRTLTYTAPWGAAPWGAAPIAPISYTGTLAQWVK